MWESDFSPALLIPTAHSAHPSTQLVSLRSSHFPSSVQLLCGYRSVVSK